jgi:hypothetical protein
VSVALVLTRGRQDVVSKSDPQVQVLLSDHTNTFREIGRTELIMNNLNPKRVLACVALCG